MSSTLLIPHPSPLRRVAGRMLRSPAGRVLDTLAAPHGVDRYLELVDPLWARDTERAVVTAVRRETADVTTLTLRPRRWRGHTAGQFVHLTVEVDGRRSTRTYSVSSSQHRRDGQLTVTVKADPDGRVSPYLVHEARPGLVVGSSAAEGGFTLPATRPDRLLLVSGGSGITPVMSILRTLAEEDAPTEVVFLHYARTPADVPFREELQELAARRDNLRLTLVTTREGAGRDAALTGHLCRDHVEAVVGDSSDVAALVCGPEALIGSATRLWDEAGIRDRLSIERFRLAPRPAVTDAAEGTLAFAAAGTTVANDGRTILEQAEASGLAPESGCRMGICHTCVKPKLAGQVRDIRDDRLSTCDPEDVQLCISVPVGDVTIDL